MAASFVKQAQAPGLAESGYVFTTRRQGESHHVTVNLATMTGACRSRRRSTFSSGSGVRTWRF